jgi:DNA repair exonuclease SbcCD ATPase subunit
MVDTHENTIEGLDEEEHATEAALEAIKERKAKVFEEVEEKWRAEEAELKHKAEEAEEAKRKEEAKRARKAEEAERVAKEAVDKRKAEVEKAEAERAEKARVAQATYKAGIRVVQADQRNLAKQTARINAQALAMKYRNLGKLGVWPNDPLMQAPVGPGLSNTEVRRIWKELVHQPKKRNLGDDDETVVLADATEYAARIAVSCLLSYFGSADLVI